MIAKDVILTDDGTYNINTVNSKYSANDRYFIIVMI